MESEYREGTPGGQAKKRKRTKTTSEPLFTASAIEPLCLYSTAGAAALVGISEEGISEWKKNGLEFMEGKALGTKQDRILGQWLIAFFEKMKTVK